MKLLSIIVITLKFAFLSKQVISITEDIPIQNKESRIYMAHVAGYKSVMRKIDKGASNKNVSDMLARKAYKTLGFTLRKAADIARHSETHNAQNVYDDVLRYIINCLGLRVYYKECFIRQFMKNGKMTVNYIHCASLEEAFIRTAKRSNLPKELYPVFSDCKAALNRIITLLNNYSLRLQTVQKKVSFQEYCDSGRLNLPVSAQLRNTPSNARVY